MLTLVEIAEKLKRFDEITLLEILEINAEEIVERFMDRIEDNQDKLRKAVD